MKSIMMLMVAAGLFVGEQPAMAQQRDVETQGVGFFLGHDLWEWCKDNRAAGYLKCVSYTAAVYEIMTGNTVNGFRMCPPSKNVSAGQVADIATNYLRNYPEVRHRLAVGLAAHAFSNAFPCRR